MATIKINTNGCRICLQTINSLDNAQINAFKMFMQK